eukprot:TRINITY_DN57935_c0_g1_i1.p1 TRINITY_DN57935_c0_g1~~TRINITY_DN57935_c0_g1_i1.p1  ORF type:complete len:1242 (+),score=225.80 TRINITY_DN57935_c0_g1_i1:58-3783(+)
MLEPRPYADWLHSEVFPPVVVVIGSEAAKARVQKCNGLSLAELFAPFGGRFQTISVTAQSLERQVSIDNLRFRFADADSASQPSATQADQVCHSAVDACSAQTAALEPRQALEPPSPWYQRWRAAMLRSLRWSEHEALDQPAAALLVVLSKEPDPVLLLEQLLHSSHMPPLCTQGVLDPVPARTAVLLHDLSDPESPGQEELAQKLERVKARFTPHLALAVQVSRGGPDFTDPEVEDLFKGVAATRTTPPPPPEPGAQASAPSAPTLQGARLTKEDLRVLAQAGTDIVVKSAVPWLEKQLQQLEAQISQNRKGFRNQLKYLWRKPRDEKTSEKGASGGDGHSDDSGSVYPLHSVEGQMRLAGDVAFHLRDYEAALGYYRSVVSDFKQDRCWKHAAGAYEMWGLCTYITHAARSEWSRCMESAYEHYLQAGCGRHAMRAVALHQAMVSDVREAAQRLIKVNGELIDSGLRSALILEQAGQLYCSSGSIRKGAFHMVLAGHTFNKLGFKKLALNSYQAVCGQYTGKRWFHITDHFQFTMARQAFGLGSINESLELFLKLLNTFSRAEKRVGVQADREQTYLKEFFFVLKHWVEKNCQAGETKSVDLQIPSIDPVVRVFLPSEQQAASLPVVGDAAAPVVAAPVAWEGLGEKLIKTLSMEDKLELQWRHRQDARVFESLRRTIAVDAAVTVELVLSNPMRVKLELRQVHLMGSLKENDSKNDLPGSLEFLSEDVDLGPLESRTLRLVARPKREGLLCITGVTWIIVEQVCCQRPLSIKGPRLRNTLEQRSSRIGIYGNDTRLELKVRAQLPQLSARLEGWPRQTGAVPSAVGSSVGYPEDPPQTPELVAENVLQGELISCSLVVSAKPGSCPPQSLRLTTSHPNFLAFQAPEDLGADIAVEQSDEVLSLEGSLGGGELRFPVLLRADQAGQHALRICLLAEASGSEGPRSERRQWITLEQQLTVCAGLSLTARPSPSHRDEDKLVFVCTMENRSTAPIEVSQLCCVTGSEEQVLQEYASNGAGSMVEPGQQAQLLLSLKRPTIASESSALKTARARLLRASHASLPTKQLQGFAGSSGSRSGRHGSSGSVAPTADLLAEWRLGKRSGEAFALRVALDRLESAPCPLDLHLLAAESASLEPRLLVPVTLRIRNASSLGPVSFYFVADSTAEVAWLGCERSEVIELSPQACHTATLHAYLKSPGVFNLNRFRLFVVGMPASAGSVPASEQAPLAFAFPFERLIHVT